MFPWTKIHISPRASFPKHLFIVVIWLHHRQGGRLFAAHAGLIIAINRPWKMISYSGRYGFMRECVLILIMPERGTRQRVKGQEFHKVSLVKPGKAQKKKKKDNCFCWYCWTNWSKTRSGGFKFKTAAPPVRRLSATHACHIWNSVSCSALHTHYLQCAPSQHRQTIL